MLVSLGLGFRSVSLRRHGARFGTYGSTSAGLVSQSLADEKSQSVSQCILKTSIAFDHWKPFARTACVLKISRPLGTPGARAPVPASVSVRGSSTQPCRLTKQPCRSGTPSWPSHLFAMLWRGKHKPLSILPNPACVRVLPMQRVPTPTKPHTPQPFHRSHQADPLAGLVARSS
jgi:hypothetical protein